MRVNFIVFAVVLLVQFVLAPKTAKATRDPTGQSGWVQWFYELPNEGTRVSTLPFHSRREMSHVFNKVTNSMLWNYAIGLIKQTATVIKDPSVAYSIEYFNLSTEPERYASSLDFPIDPLLQSTVFAELTIELFDENGDGHVSVTGDYGKGGAIQGAVLRSPTAQSVDIGLPIGANISSPGTHTFILDAMAGPGLADGNEVSLSTFFTLSPGDRAHLTGRFVIDEGTGIPFAEIPEVPDPADGPFFNVINSPDVIIGNGQQINSQTQLNVFDGGSVGDNFQVGDFTGGDSDVELNIFDGEVGSNLLTGAGSVVNIHGGTVGGLRANRPGGTVNVTGGSIENFFTVNDSSAVANISGGSLGSVSISEGTVNLSGGTIGELSMSVPGDGILNVMGTEFTLGGDELELIPGEPLAIDSRDAVLAGTLLDGSTFSFDLAGFDEIFDIIVPHFEPNATINVMLIAELAGDFDGDALVGQGDLDLVLLNWGANATNLPGNWATGSVDQDELDAVLLGWGMTAAVPATNAVPEPTTWVLLLAAALSLTARRIRRR